MYSLTVLVAAQGLYRQMHSNKIRLLLGKCIVTKFVYLGKCIVTKFVYIGKCILTKFGTSSTGIYYYAVCASVL